MKVIMIIYGNFGSYSYNIVLLSYTMLHWEVFLISHRIYINKGRLNRVMELMAGQIRFTA